MNDIVCPNCGKRIEISEALRHEFEEKVRKEEQSKAKEEIEKIKLQTQADLEKKLKEEFENKTKESKLQLEEAEKKQKELQEKLTLAAKEQKENEEKIKIEAAKEASEKARLEKLEYEKKIGDMQKALEEAQRKGKQGSQQLQGEVLELDLEERLKQTFPNDEFLPIPKGVEGGDIWQKVKLNGKVVGSILWETKRTKAWSKGWITKLKEDAGRVSASEAIIVSQVLPEDSKSFDRKDGIWITDYETAINICRFIRFLISTVATVKSSASQTEEEWGRIRDYMMSDSFKHRMQAHFDGIKALRDSLDAEKRSTILRWKKQESQIEKLDTNTTNFYGELKSIVSNLPEISGVDTLLLEDSDEEAQETLI